MTRTKRSTLTFWRAFTLFTDEELIEGLSYPPYCRIASSANVRFGSKADMCSAKCHVWFTPIADICSALAHVRFVPIADIGHTVVIALPVSKRWLISKQGGCDEN